MCWSRWCAAPIFITSRLAKILHPLLIEREEKNVLVIVIAGDKGFAGGFNSNVGKAAQKFIDKRVAQGQNIDLEPIGKKAIALLQEKVSRGKLREDGRALR